MSKLNIVLVCEECLSRNYKTRKSNFSNQKIELKKHCKNCSKHTAHIESR